MQLKFLIGIAWISIGGRAAAQSVAMPLADDDSAMVNAPAVLFLAPAPAAPAWATSSMLPSSASGSLREARLRELNMRVAAGAEGSIDPRLAFLTLVVMTGGGGTIGLMSEVLIAIYRPGHHVPNLVVPGALIGFGASIWIIAKAPGVRRHHR